MFRSFLALSVVALLSAAGCNGVDSKKADGDLSALSVEARAALTRAGTVYAQPLRGAKWDTVHCGGAESHPVYQVRGTNARGHKIEIELTKAGRIIEVEEHGIPMTEVPTAVRDALTAKDPKFVVERAEAIYQMESPTPVAFGFEGRDASGKPGEFYFAADGKSILN